MKRIYKIKSSHVTTESLWDKVNCKSTILSRMIGNCLKFLEKKFNESVTIRKKKLTIKQLIELI